MDKSFAVHLLRDGDDLLSSALVGLHVLLMLLLLLFPRRKRNNSQVVLQYYFHVDEYAYRVSRGDSYFVPTAAPPGMMPRVRSVCTHSNYDFYADETDRENENLKLQLINYVDCLYATNIAFNFQFKHVLDSQ